MDTVRFYWSFRSPYSWFAFELAERVLDGLPVQLEYLAVFPPPNYPNDPTRVPNKVVYMIEHDLPRLARHYGLPYQRPVTVETQWIRPHSMWQYAAGQGQGLAFGKAVFAARWSHGKDLNDDAALAECARQVGLDPAATVAAGDDVAFQTRVMEGMIRGATEDGIFGVPLFVFRGERFWGHDRLEFLVQRIQEVNGLPAQTGAHTHAIGGGQ
jgi:2-hydroxychromene-2-carboxylate isomerase